jgi:glyoxylase-like metal-dependent hydrolase (beta-lactamase superfamily II)
MVKTETMVVGPLETNCIIVADMTSHDACIIDPGDEPDRIMSYIDAHGLRPHYVIFTHAHYDHVCAVRELKEKYHCRLVMHDQELKTYEDTKRYCMSRGYDAEDFPLPDITVKEDDALMFGNASFRVIHTPGHTPGSICLYGNGLLITGDTLFRGAAGRTDLPGGSMRDLRDSLKKLRGLPHATRVLCGHDAETTIAIELKTNPFMTFP